MEKTDYLAFRDAVIVALADDQEPPGLGEMDIADLCKRHGIFAQETWIMTVGNDMQSLGWGKDTSTLKSKRFLINGGGLARAAEIRQARKPITLKQRLQKIPVGKGIWEITKLLLAAAAGAAASSYLGK